MILDSEGKQGAIRKLVRDGDGEVCPIDAIAKASFRRKTAKRRGDILDLIEQLDEEWVGDVVVWGVGSDEISDIPIGRSERLQQARIRQELISDALAVDYPNKVEPPGGIATGVLVHGVNKYEVMGLLSNPLVAELSLQSEQVQELVALCQECASHCSFSGYCSWGLTSYKAATSAGDGIRVGIHEGSAYSDSRITPYFSHLQLGAPGMGGFSSHPDMVASVMWGSELFFGGGWGYGYLRDPNGNAWPFSVGIADGDESVLFARYQQAMAYFLQYNVHVINYSAYFPMDWSLCGSQASRDFELLQDRYQMLGGMLIVQAVANLCETGELCLRLTNALTVGGDNPVMSQTQDVGFYGSTSGDGPDVPDVVVNCYGTGPSCEDVGEPGMNVIHPDWENYWVCGGGNSFNAPVVTSLAAMIHGLAEQEEEQDATWPETIRAIIMASADYSDFEGLEESNCKGCLGSFPCDPVDCSFGAGRVDGEVAFDIYQGGDYEFHTVSGDDWGIQKEFSCPTGSCSVKVAAAWDNVVDCDSKGCTGDGHISHDIDVVVMRGVRMFSPFFGWMTRWSPVIRQEHLESTSEWLQVEITGNVSDQYQLLVYLQSRDIAQSTYLGLAYKTSGLVWN